MLGVQRGTLFSFIFLPIVWLTAGEAWAEPREIGLMGYGNFSSQTAKIAQRDRSQDLGRPSRFGGSIGLQYRHFVSPALSRIYLGADVIYLTRHHGHKFNQVDGIRSHWLTLAPGAEFRLWRNRSFDYFIGLGPYHAKMLGKFEALGPGSVNQVEGNFLGQFRRSEWGWHLATGLTGAISSRLKFVGGVRLQRSITDAIELNEELKNELENNQDGELSSHYFDRQFTLGLRYGF